MADTGRRRKTANPDVVLKRVVALMSSEVERLQQRAALMQVCPGCSIEAGLTPEERRWLAQAMRDLTRLALGGRKQLIEELLRNLSDGQLDAVEKTGTGKGWLPS